MKKLLLSLAALCATSILHASLLYDINISTEIFAVENSDTLRLDILNNASTPSGQKSPAIIFLSGGGWEGQARRTAITDSYPLLPYFVNRGFVGVAADYRCDFKRARQSGEIPDMNIGEFVASGTLDTPGVAEAIDRAVTTAVDDLFVATRHIIDNADRYGIDPRRIVVIGSSAGAITALTAEHIICSSGKSARKLLPHGFNYAAVVPMAGGVWCHDSKTDTLQWRSKPCPIMMFHGDKDPIVSYTTLRVPSSRWSMNGVSDIARQLSRMDVINSLHTFAGMNHDAAVVPMATHLPDIYNFLTHTIVNPEQSNLVASETVEWSKGKGLDTYKSTAVDNIVRRSYLYKIADGDSLRLDVYRKADDIKRPILFYCHGGGWQAGERHDMSLDRLNMTQWFADNGWVVVTIDYRLAFQRQCQASGIPVRDIVQYIVSGDFDRPEVWQAVSNSIDIAIDDTVDALAFTLSNAEAWNADTSRVVATGGSAGAINLLTLEHRLCNDTHPALTSRLPDGFNFSALVPMAGGVWLNDNRPLQWKRQPCPMLLFHGDSDPIVPYATVSHPTSGASLYGSATIATQLRDLATPYMLYTVTGGDHAWSANPVIFNREDIIQTLKRILDDCEPQQLDMRLTLPSTDRNGGWFGRYVAGQGQPIR